MWPAVRGLMWIATFVGLGSWFGGDKIENQTVVKQTTWTEKIVWLIVLLSVLGGFSFLLWILFSRNKKKRNV